MVIETPLSIVAKVTKTILIGQKIVPRGKGNPTDGDSRTHVLLTCDLVSSWATTQLLMFRNAVKENLHDFTHACDDVKGCATMARLRSQNVFGSVGFLHGLLAMVHVSDTSFVYFGGSCGEN